MRAWLIIGWVFLLPGLLRAAPVPPPPDDYSGAQYIDGSGCVYLRDGASWQQRLDREGAPVCGFPPSLPPGGADAGPVPSTQERLAEILATDLRPGEWTSDPQPVEERRDPAPVPGGDRLTRDVADSLQVMAQVRGGAAASTTGSDRVCSLLGYAPVGSDQQVVGHDVTLGLCPGMRAGVPAPQVMATATKADAVARPRKNDARDAPEPAAVVEDRRRVAGPAVQGRPQPAPSTPVDRVVKDQPEMIPASARFVRVGAFADDANATLVLRKLSAMGYPVGQRYEQRAGQRVRAIMAGPFTDRQSLISALNQIRRKGYPGATAR